MIKRVRCNSCDGEYAPIGLDGVRYFHACAPLSPAELEKAVAIGAIVLSRLELEDALSGRRPIARPLARDENVPSTRERDAGEVKSTGTGTAVIVEVAAEQEITL